MKSEFFNNVRNRLKSAVNFSDDENEEYYDDEYYDDEEYEDEDYPQQEKHKSNDSHSKSYKTSSRFSEYDSIPEYKTTPVYETERKVSKTTSGARIYDMNSAKPQRDLNINLFVLEDLDDARNVADCMKKRNVICIAEFSRVSLKEERRILDFIDGVKYILQSKVTKIADRMYLIVPGSTILTGPFEDNFDIDYE